MSTRSGRKGEKKRGKDHSPDQWSDWKWDAAGARYYRARLTKHGGCEYEYAGPPEAETPRNPEYSVPRFDPSTETTTSIEDHHLFNSSLDTVTGIEDQDEFRNLISAVPPTTSIEDHHLFNSSLDTVTGIEDQDEFRNWISAVSPTVPSDPFPTFSSDPYPLAASFPSAAFSAGTYPEAYTSSRTFSSPRIRPLYSSRTDPLTSCSSPSFPSSTAAASTLNEVASSFGSLSIANPPTNDYGSQPDDRYTIRSQPSRFFQIGRVFKIFWSEPASVPGKHVMSNSDFISVGAFEQPVFTKVRRFVVIRKRLHCCLCLPILTYRGQGAAKNGVRAEDHAIVYQAGRPQPLASPGEELSKDPLGIVLEDSREKLDRMSRIDFGKVYTVQHNLKVVNVGRISSSDMDRLKRYYNESMGILDYSENTFSKKVSQGSSAMYS